MNPTYLFRVPVATLAAGIALFGVGCARDPVSQEAQFLKNGRGFLEKKDYNRAILQFRNAVQRRPMDPEAYYQLGLAYVGKADLKQAAACFQKTLQLQPKHPGAMLKLAGIMGVTPVRENVQRAEKMAQELLDASPGNVEVIDTLAAAQVRLGKIDDAEKHLLEALRHVPAHLEASVALARIKLSRGDRAGAEQALRDAVAQNPKATEPLVMLGEFYSMLQRTADAETAFRRALTVDAAGGAALYDLGALLMKTDRKAEAGDVYLRLAALDDKRYRPIHAQYLYSIGKTNEAIAEFTKLAGAASGDRDARSRLVAAYVNAGRTAEASKLLSAALEKNPKDVEARLERSQILLSEARYGDAQMDLNEVLHFRPDSAAAHYGLAHVFEASGAVENRKQELSEVLRIQPGALAARLDLARMMTAAGDGTSALELLSRAPAAQRELPAVLLQRNWSLIASGNYAGARANLDRLLKPVRVPGAVLQDAVLRFHGKDYPGARAAAEEVLQAEPANVGALAVLLDSAAAQGQAAKGIELVTAYAGRQSGSAPVQQFLGQVLASTRNFADARKAFELAKAANSKATTADLALANLDIVENRLDQARQRILALPPASASAFILLGNVEERAENHTQAIAAYRRALEFDPRNSVALNNLAYLLAEFAGAPDEALKFAQQAKEAAPKDAAVDDTLGWAYFHKGIYGTAIRHLEGAVGREPTARRQYHLAMAYWKSGDQRRSREALKTALKIDPALPESAAALRIMGDR